MKSCDLYDNHQVLIGSVNLNDLHDCQNVVGLDTILGVFCFEITNKGWGHNKGLDSFCWEQLIASKVGFNHLNK